MMATEAGIAGRPHHPLTSEWRMWSSIQIVARPMSKDPAINDFLLAQVGGPTREAALRLIAGDYPGLVEYMLLKRPALAEEIGLRSGNAMRVAFQSHSIHSMWLLKKLEASFDIYASDGTPLLFEVIDSKDINSELDDILKAGANPNVQSRHPETGELPDNGENLGLKYSAGQTPLIYAVWSGHLSYGKQPIPALVVGQIKYDFNSKLSAIRELLKRGANVNIRDENGLTALHYAARSDYNVQLVKILLEKGADINARDNERVDAA